MNNVADLKDPNDPQGRTYREINNATSHNLTVDDLVELDDGVRLFVTRLTRDCDGTPLYCLGRKGNTVIMGYTEDSLTLVNPPHKD